MAIKDQLETILADARASWRFRWTGLAVAWVVCIAGSFLVLSLPDKYESRAQIYVDTTSILKPLLQGIAVSPNTENAADAVRRALLSRPTLEKVARKTDLILRAHNPDEAEQILLGLEKEITITGDNKSNVYTIVYTDRNAKMAQGVVQTLLDTFVEDSLGVSRTDTRNAQRFLEQQVKDYESRLSQSEERLAEFKKKYIGLMPDQRGDYFNRLQTEQTNAAKLQTDLSVALRQRDELRRKLVGDAHGTGAPPPVPTDQQIQTATALDAQIQESQRKLDALLLQFTEKHPDVIALRDTIARLEQRRNADLGGVRATTATPGANGGLPGVDPVLQSLQIQLNTADVQVAALQAQVDQANGRVAELRRMLTTGPEVEAELAQLNRDYGVTKAQYEALLQRLESAKISDKADQSEDARYKLLDPPRVPLRPTAPMRSIMLIAVLIAAFVAGGAAAYAANFVKPVYVSPKRLSESLGVPVLGVVTRFINPAAAAWRRRDRLGLAGAAGFLVAAFGVLVVFNHLGSTLLRSSLGLE